MRVFVWRSYGNASVYSAETGADLRHLMALIGTAIEGWGDEVEEAWEKHNQRLLATPDDAGARERIVDKFLGQCRGHHESFETAAFADVEDPRTARR